MKFPKHLLLALLTLCFAHSQILAQNTDLRIDFTGTQPASFSWLELCDYRSAFFGREWNHCGTFRRSRHCNASTQITRRVDLSYAYRNLEWVSRGGSFKRSRQ